MNVYKYRSAIKQDIKSLCNNQFYASNIDYLNDILESKIKMNNKEFKLFDLILTKTAPNMKTNITKILNNFLIEAKKFGIYSLSKNYDNELLWAYYSNSHKGFCIEYDFNILKQYQLNGEFYCDVKYEETIPTINLSDILDKDKLTKKLLATKSISWKHEEEFRVITGENGVFHYYNKSLKSIYFGYRTEEKIVKLIMRLLRGRNTKYYKMYPKNDLYELERKEINDLYKGYIKPLNRKINKFIPEYDKETKQYKKLIEKAISIVLQEPMCDEILNAYINSSKGTKKNPVFCITYKDKIRNLPAINYCITKDEIEAFKD